MITCFSRPDGGAMRESPIPVRKAYPVHECTHYTTVTHRRKPLARGGYGLLEGLGESHGGIVRPCLSVA